jgi:molybdopterin-containing oxidoreductase family membrane subunit
MSDIEQRVLGPVLKASNKFWAVTIILSLLAIFSLYALYVHATEGTGPTGLEPPSNWSIHITNFVYFLSLGFGLILISAVIRLRGSEWGAAAPRLADVIAMLAFGVAGINIVFEVGSLHSLVDIILYGQVDSPFIWDGLILIFFLVVSAGYMYMPMVPDFTRISLRLDVIKGFYRFFSFGYVGNPMQRVNLRRMVLIASALVIVVLLLMSTVLAWAFDAVSTQPVWNAAITGPYFLTSALVIAVPVLIIGLAHLRRLNGLEDYLNDDVFARLGKILTICIGLFLIFFALETVFREYTVGSETVSATQAIWNGRFAHITFAIFLIGLVIPALIMNLPGFRGKNGVVTAAIMTTVMMWFKSYLVVVPGITHHLAPYKEGIYMPDWPEWGLIVGSFAFLALLIVAFTRFFPLVSIWEVEDQARGHEDKEGSE